MTSVWCALILDHIFLRSNTIIVIIIDIRLVIWNVKAFTARGNMTYNVTATKTDYV